MTSIPLFDLDSGFTEKRDFIRMLLQTRIKITMDGLENHVYGVTVNLSGNGILFTSEHEFPVDSELQITIDSTGNKFSNFNILVKVNRIDYSSKTELYSLAGIILEHHD